jgi:hypothetical protein
MQEHAQSIAATTRRIPVLDPERQFAAKAAAL